MLTRRSFVAGIAFATIPAWKAADAGALALPLWPGEPPGGGGPEGPLKENLRHSIWNVGVPAIDVWMPERPNGIAVLIAAGGGYRRIALGGEAWPAARWLNAHNITAFVLSYRLPGEGWRAGPAAPLQDAQRALRLIRARAGQFRLDPKRVGVLGFSAGGHLMGLAATRSAFCSYQPIDGADDLSARPDFAALIYPVITLRAPYDHTSTRRVLIGTHPDAQEIAEWSVETHVEAKCPPMFLVQAENDPISNPANTVIMEQACRRANVPVELHKLASGGHGFGMGKATGPTSLWPGHFAHWLDRIESRQTVRLP